MIWELRSKIDDLGNPVLSPLGKLIGRYGTFEEARTELLSRQRTGGTLFVLNIETSAEWVYNP